MSKKDKKRIAELERQQSILSAKVRVLAHYFAQVLAAKEQPQFEQGSISQNEPKQDKSEQKKPAQAKPITPEKEQELLAKLNAELAKFASLEVFNADRKNFFLPPVGKLEFDKMKAAIECTIAIAKMVSPDYFDQINQIKVPVSEQPEAEPKQGSDGADSPKKSDTDQPEIHQPDRTKATLSKMVLGRIEETEKLLANPNLGVGELSFFIDDCAKDLQLELADFRRKHLDLGAVEQGEVEPKETVQGEEKQPQADQTSPEKLGEADQTEPKKGQVWIVQTNPKKAERLNPFYIDYVGEDNIIRHTPNPDEAMNFIECSTAQIEIDNIIKNGKGRYSAADFKLRQIGAKQPE
jgi:hypothetical protein